jgi:UDP-N-acetylglucosamine 3-dehydrogenase
VAIRCAVIGIGAMGSEHVEVLASSSRAELVCCCDTDPGARARLPVGVDFTTELDSALSAPGLQAVFVCTPQDHHATAVLAALERGLAVFCEKPIADTLAAADVIVEAAARALAPVAVGHILRFDPRYLAVLDAVADASLGMPVQLASRRNVSRSEGEALAGRTSLAVELLVHDLDIMRVIAGEVDRVYAEESTVGSLGGHPGALVGTLRFQSGAVASFETDWVMGPGDGAAFDFRLEVVGTEGRALIELRDEGVELFTAAGLSRPRIASFVGPGGTRQGLVRTEDEYFLDMLGAGPAWPVSPADARATLAVAVAIQHAVAAGRPVSVAELG